jgi:hypothetical protein
LNFCFVHRHASLRRPRETVDEFLDLRNGLDVRMSFRADISEAFENIFEQQIVPDEPRNRPMNEVHDVLSV